MDLLVKGSPWGETHVRPALLATVFGTVRNVFERNPPPNQDRAVQGQLMMMCNAYLEAARSPR
jgi:hypothetical protein